jgi:hypothetical protein
MLPIKHGMIIRSASNTSERWRQTMPKTEMTVIPLQQADLNGNPPLNPNNPLLARTISPVTDLAPKSVKRVEPEFRALCRILGWKPNEVLPAELCEAVDAVYEWGQHNPDTFQCTPFDTAQERDDALTVMRAYAECPGDVGYTIYTKVDKDPSMLIWKVTRRRGHRDDSE